jgi:hypothetical protein
MGGAARAVAERNTLRHMTDGWFDLYRSLLAGRFGTTVG